MIVNRFNTDWPRGLHYLLAGLVLVVIVTTLQAAYWVGVADTYAQGLTAHNVYFTAVWALAVGALVAGLAGRRRLFTRTLGVAAGVNLVACTFGMVSWMRAIVAFYHYHGELGVWLGELATGLAWTLTCLGVSAAGLIGLLRVERAPGR